MHREDHVWIPGKVEASGHAAREDVKFTFCPELSVWGPGSLEWETNLDINSMCFHGQRCHSFHELPKGVCDIKKKKKRKILGVPMCLNKISGISVVQEAGSIPALAQWDKGSGIAVAAA